ncbi:MAG: hypothetical protein M1823_002615 [Watsoniomyces obsoletus]|nr:MAG: hypothetical protein M1823_002615 [Watsoniomyces obsoletus]
MTGPDPYSTLEVQIDRTTGLEIPVHHGLEALGVASSIDQESTSPHPEKSRRTLGLRRWVWLLVIGVAVLAVMAAVIVGSVMGTAARRRQSSSTARLSASVTVSVTAPTSTPTSTPSPESLLSNSKMSAIAFVDGQGNLQHRLYFQDANNTIRESTWKEGDGGWQVSNAAIATAKSGSPLAAAVAWGPPPMQQINLFYINDTGHINERYTNDGSSWRAGSLNRHNIVPAATSALTAVWHRHDICRRCPNTPLLVYQDDRGRFNLGNGTAQGWQWSVLNANPVPGSGASLAVFNQLNTAEVRLYYQIASGNLCSLNWKEQVEVSSRTFQDRWENNENSPLPIISKNAPITSFAYGIGPNRTVPILLDILSSSSRGVNNIWWSGAEGGKWSGPQSPEVMNAVNNYTVLAADTWAHVYAMQGQEIKEFKVEDDGITWTMRGSVPTS